MGRYGPTKRREEEVLLSVISTMTCETVLDWSTPLVEARSSSSALLPSLIPIFDLIARFRDRISNVIIHESSFETEQVISIVEVADT